MNNVEFLETIEELHWNRRIPFAEIAKELKISTRMIDYLRKHEKRLTPKVLKRGQVVLPKLMETYCPLTKSKKYTQYGMNLEAKPDEAAKKNQELRDRILASIERGKNREAKSPLPAYYQHPSKA
jgi:hypothetical protein